jgi:hypothetical protein
MIKFMKKYILMLLIFASCTQNVIEGNITNDVLITESAFQYINTDLNLDYENFTDKKTIIVFWADY